jgi:hypothetical protein
MRLAAIYNVWCGEEHLRGSMECLRDHVDLFIIVTQNVSNFGEWYSPTLDIKGFNTVVLKYTPAFNAGAINETNKRNLGLEVAKAEGCTHFLHMDTDEYYTDFGKAKREYMRSGLNGSVCKIFTYFKKPEWRCDREDGYFVPFIHKLKPDSRCGRYPYPFHVDPTRKVNETDVVLLDTHMHHMSWVRANIERKCRNSSAKVNIERGTLLKDYYDPELERSPDGFYIRDWDRKITIVPNIFNIRI